MDVKTCQNIRKSLRYIIQNYEILSDKVWSNFGVSYAQSQVLFELGANPGIHAKTLCKRLMVDKSTVSRLLKKLSCGKYVEFKIDPTDTRSKKIFLTTKGNALLSKLNKFGNKKTEEIFKNVSPREIKAIDRALEMLRT